MILYINGDEHSAAAEAVVPNPENVKVSYGSWISKVLKAKLIVEARKQTNDEIIAATKKFLNTNPVKEEILVIIGFPELNEEQFKEFGAYLKSKEVKHILYPSSDYIKWLTENKFEPNKNGYFGEAAHKAWAAHLIKPLTQIL